MSLSLRRAEVRTSTYSLDGLTEDQFLALAVVVNAALSTQPSLIPVAAALDTAFNGGFPPTTALLAPPELVRPVKPLPAFVAPADDFEAEMAKQIDPNREEEFDRIMAGSRTVPLPEEN